MAAISSTSSSPPESFPPEEDYLLINSNPESDALVDLEDEANVLVPSTESATSSFGSRLFKLVSNLASLSINGYKLIKSGSKVASDSVYGVGKKVVIATITGGYAISAIARQKIKSFDASKQVVECETRMLDALNDFHYINFYRTINNQVLILGERTLANYFNSTTERFKPDFTKILQESIKATLAQAFANLAETLHENRFLIPNYSNQTSLVNLIILFNQKMGSRLPDLKTMYEMGPEELRQAFNDINQEIYHFLLPNGLGDIKLPFSTVGDLPGVSHLRDAAVKGFILPFFKGLQDFLYESYMSLIGTQELRLSWRDNLQRKMGFEDTRSVYSVVASPSTFVMEYIKSILGTDPSTSMEWGMTAADFIESSENNSGLKRLDKIEMANWILLSIHQTLRTDNHTLQNFGKFIKNRIEFLTLALVSKLADLGHISSDPSRKEHFIQDMLENAFKKLKELRTDKEITLEDIQEFTKDLPLPPIILNHVVSNFFEKVQKLREQLQTVKVTWDNLQAKYEIAFEKVKHYAGGKELISITKAVSDSFFEIATEKNLDLLKEFDLDDQVERLMAQYLPEVKFSPELKIWFQKNFKGLGGKDGHAPDTILLLKKAIEGTILQYFVKTIEETYKNDDRQFSAKLLGRIREGFINTFRNINEEERNNLLECLEIEKEIKGFQQNKKGLIEEFQAFKRSLTKLPEKENDIIKAALNKKEKALNAAHLKMSLNRNLIELLKKLNNTRAVRTNEIPWTPEKMDQFEISFNRLKYSNKIDKLKLVHPGFDEIAILEVLEKEIEAHPSSVSNAVLADCRNVIEVLRLSEESVKIVYECLSIKQTITRAHLEEQQALQELEICKKDLLGHDSSRLEGPVKMSWEKGLEGFARIEILQASIANENSQIQIREKLLEQKLSIFQTLSNELLSILNLNSKENLPLPDQLKNSVWPLIVAAKQNYLPRVLFDQMYPLIALFLDQDINRKRLEDLTGTQAFSGLASEMASQAIGRIPQFMSLQPITKEILNIHNIVSPNQVEIAKLNGLHTLLPDILKIDGRKKLDVATIKKFLILRNLKDNLEEVSQNLHQNLETLTKENIVVLIDGKMSKKEALNLFFDIEEESLKAGKKTITPTDLFDLYRRELSKRTGIDVVFEDATKTIFIEKIVKEKIIEKINAVALTSTEIALQLRKSIPGAVEVEKLIEKELDEVFVGDNLSFQENKQILKGCIESVILKLFLKWGEFTQNKKFIQKLHEKLKTLSLEHSQNHLTKEEINNKLNQIILTDILEISSPDSLTDIPFAFREIAFNLVSVQMREKLFPLFSPFITKERDYRYLKAKSPLLASISKALASDLTSAIPTVVANRKALTDKIFNRLLGHAGTPDQLNTFYKKIVEAFEKASKNNSGSSIKNKEILKAYLETLGIELISLEKEKLLDRIKAIKCKQELNGVLFTSEGIISQLLNILPGLNEKTQNELKLALNGFISPENTNYKAYISLLEDYLEGLLLKVFIKTEEKNPSTAGKDSLVLITEKIVTLLTEQCQIVFNYSEEIKARVKKENPNEEPSALNKKIQHEIKVALQDRMKQLADKILNDVLGLNSLILFEGIPNSQRFIYEAIQAKVQEFTVSFAEHLYSLDNLDEGMKESQRKAQQLFGSASILTALQDLGNITPTSTFHTLGSKVEDNIKGVFTATESTLSVLEEMVKEKSKMAEVLLRDANGKPLQSIIGDIYQGLNINPSQPFDQLPKAQQVIQAGKAKAAEYVGNVLLKPLMEAFERLFEKESDKNHDQNGQLITALMGAFSKHLEIIKQAKLHAQARKETQFTHADFVEAAGDHLHKGVPKADPDFTRSVSLIKKALNIEWGNEKENNIRHLLKNKASKDGSGVEPIRIDSLIEALELELEIPLTQEQKNKLKEIEERGIPLKEILREEWDLANIQRNQHFYHGLNKDILKALFPNGSKDLTFVTPELRGTVWNLLKKKLFPIITPLLVELLLDPDTITTIFINSLETMNENLSGPIQIDDTTSPTDETQKELNRASGEVLKHCIDMAKLPNWLVKMLKTKTGEINPVMAESLGTTLRSQFNKEFFKRTLKISFDTLASRDLKGEPKIYFDVRNDKIKDKEKATNRVKMENELSRLVRKSVDVGISFFIRNQWVQLQHKWNKAIARRFGKIGATLKKALDALFHFIFIKVIGTFISYLMYPVTILFRKAIYALAKLDQNKDIIMDIFRKQPDDQPKSSHTVYNENLIFHLLDALRANLKKS